MRTVTVRFLLRIRFSVRANRSATSCWAEKAASTPRSVDATSSHHIVVVSRAGNQLTRVRSITSADASPGITRPAATNFQKVSMRASRLDSRSLRASSDPKSPRGWLNSENRKEEKQYHRQHHHDEKPNTCNIQENRHGLYITTFSFFRCSLCPRCSAGGRARLRDMQIRGCSIPPGCSAGEGT